MERTAGTDDIFQSKVVIDFSHGRRGPLLGERRNHIYIRPAIARACRAIAGIEHSRGQIKVFCEAQTDVGAQPKL